MKKTSSFRWKNFIGGMLFLLLAALPLRAEAEEGAVTLGSAEYSPTEREEFSIGLYIQCASPRYIYDVSVQYDPSRMEYLGGADGGGEGVLKFVGESLAPERKYMLSFRALEEGETSISVIEASVITNPVPPVPEEGEGEGSQPPAQPPEVVAVTQMGSAAVKVQPEILPGLSRLSIEEFPDFALEEGVYDYTLEAFPDTERLTINARPRDDEARVDVSETALQTGENQIRITVETGAERRVYTLTVNRPEPARESLEPDAEPTVPAMADLDGQSGPMDTTPGQGEPTVSSGDSSVLTAGEAENGFPSADATPLSENGGKNGRTGSRKALILVALLCTLAAIFGMALALIFRRRRRRLDEEDYLDDGMEEEWFDLDEGKWKKWLEEMDDAEDDPQEDTQKEGRVEIRKETGKEAGKEIGKETLKEAQTQLEKEEEETGRRREEEEKKAEKPQKPQAGKPEGVNQDRVKKDTSGKETQPEAPSNEKPASLPKETAKKPAVPSEVPKTAAPEAAGKTADNPQDASCVIRIQDVSMRFKISEANAGSLKEYILATVKKQNRYHELRALDHISFQIAKGEVVGIVGTNGSGKSTLLKLIAGAMKPTEGEIDVDRRKVQLLTLGTGFDTELTARENVYLNGAIIGYSREFIDENYDKIVEFAELDGFMDEKIKNFSSGMVSRLGFAIATVGESPEILILDEVLSVGDMFFRKKSEKRIKEMIHGGSTVLIVSHSTDVILKNCTKAVWIEKGVLREIGDPKKVCEAYRKQAG